MKHRILRIIIFLTYYSVLARSLHPKPYALSPVYLQYLENAEFHITNYLSGVTKPNLATIRYLEAYHENVGAFRNQSESDTSRNFVSSNPIHSLQMINRFVKYFNKEVQSSLTTNFIGTESLPGFVEVEDAMEALLRLQYFYDLDAHQLSNGVFQGFPTSARLKVGECLELGKFAQESEYFSLALQWYDTVLREVRLNGPKPGITLELVQELIKTTIEEHNQDYEESMEHGDMYSFSVPLSLDSSNFSDISYLSLRKLLPSRLSPNEIEENHPDYSQTVEAKMMELCSGKSLQSENTTKRLKCYLDTSKHSYWRINPLKVEVLSESPKIIQMYDIFNDKWISYLKSISHSVLERAPQPPEATPRTAAYAWLEDEVIPDIPVSKVVEYITGLNVVGKDAAEELQVAAYAFGGHVAPHHDSFDLGETDESPAYASSGQQVLTFLAYLSEVEKGGHTAFPLVGISIKPIKNSAVLWYTKKKNEEVDNRTLHAACPVILGQKWIATKWPRIAENFLRRPCGLSPDE